MPRHSRKPVTFVERHGLWSDAQAKAAAQVERTIKRERLEVVRFSFADQHGVLRGKTLLASEVASAMRSGVTMTTTLLAKDTAHRTVYPVFTPGGGFAMERYAMMRTVGTTFINMVPGIAAFARVRFGGPRYAKELADRAVVTWTLNEGNAGIQAFSWTPTVNRIQAVLHGDGVIELSYDGVNAKDGVVGVFPNDMDAREAGEWRRRIQAWCRFRLRMVPSRGVAVAVREEQDPFLP